VEATCYIAGEWRPAEQATVHLFDSGLMFGETLTETLRTFDGVPFEVEGHVTRLERSMQLARIEPDPAHDVRALIAECAERGRAAFGTDVLIKVDVTRGIFGYYRRPGVEYAASHLFLHALPVPFWKFADSYDRGIAVAYPATRHVHPSILDPRIKHRSRLYQAIAELEAGDVEEGATALMLDHDGHVTEGTGWNVFAVRDGRVITPPTDCCLEGVSRAVTLELCAELGIEAVERTLLPYDLAVADELFATATSYCHVPNTRVHGQVAGGGRRGPVADRLLGAWSDRAGLDNVDQARRGAGAAEPAHAGT
jgi:branched-chain amino acid aminotransferase